MALNFMEKNAKRLDDVSFFKTLVKLREWTVGNNPALVGEFEYIQEISCGTDFLDEL